MCNKKTPPGYNIMSMKQLRVGISAFVGLNLDFSDFRKKIHLYFLCHMLLYSANRYAVEGKFELCGSKRDVFGFFRFWTFFISKKLMLDFFLRPQKNTGWHVTVARMSSHDCYGATLHTHHVCGALSCNAPRYSGGHTSTVIVRIKRQWGYSTLMRTTV